MPVKKKEWLKWQRTGKRNIKSKILDASHRFLVVVRKFSSQEGVKKLAGGILYKVTEQGSGTVSPRLDNVVSVHYRGTLMNGREFDNSYERNCPEAFRLNQVIEGWQIALQQMHVGHKWIIYIPYTVGYGNRASGPIPAFSTLIFEVELLGIA